MVAMEGKTLSWFRWWRFCRSNPSWEDFKAAVISKFQPEFDLDIRVQEVGSESWEQDNRGKNEALKFKNQLGREEAIHKEVEQVKETNIKIVVAKKEMETELELHAGTVVEVQETDVADKIEGERKWDAVKENNFLGLMGQTQLIQVVHLRTKVHLEIHDELFHKFQIVAGSVLQAIRFLCKTFKQKLEAGLGEMFKGSWQQEGLREFSFDPGGIQQLLAIGPNITPQPLPLMLSEDYGLQVEPVGVLAARNNQSGNVEVLMQWKELPAFEATWEPFDVIQAQFPQFHLEDKVKLLGGSIVSKRPPVKNVYARKGK